jgi:hypothetical protein
MFGALSDVHAGGNMKCANYVKINFKTGARGRVVVKALYYKPEVAGSIPDEIIS